MSTLRTKSTNNNPNTNSPIRNDFRFKSGAFIVDANEYVQETYLMVKTGIIVRHHESKIDGRIERRKRAIAAEFSNIFEIVE